METDDEDIDLLETKDGEELAQVMSDSVRIAPARPGPCKAKAGDGKATVWWTERCPEDTEEDLYAKPDVYVVYKYRLDGNEWKEKGGAERLEVKYPTTTVTVDGLTNGRQFQFAVRARSRKGVPSKESARSNAVTPYLPLPEPWTEHFDAMNNKPFYYNPETKQKTYTRPTENRYQVSVENKERFQSKEITKLRVQFADVDQDGSGFLDEEELGELFKDLDMPLKRSKVRRLIRAIDSDGSGKIEFDEFLTMMYKLRRGELNSISEHFAALVNGSAFKNTAGLVLNRVKMKLGGEERRLEREHRQRMLDRERMGNWVEKFDEARRRKYYFNKETKAKSWELPEDVLWYVPLSLRGEFTENEIDEFQQQFERFDEDQSGEMDADEMTEAIRALGEDIPHKEVLALIKEVDVDNSGEINFAEFVQLMAMRKRKNRATTFLPMIPLAGNNNSPSNKAELHQLRKQVIEIKKENNYLRQKVVSLQQENKKLRSKKFVFVPVIPLKEFLDQVNLGQYYHAMAQFGIRDTTDLFRLEEHDYDHELGFKLGHKRKIIHVLKQLEE